MKKILFLGAGFLQSYAIKTARKLGYEVHAIDGSAGAVGFEDANFHATINIVDIESCLKYAKENNVDGVLSVATDYGVLGASYISEKLGLPGNPLSVAKIIKNKYQVRKEFYKYKVDDFDLAYEVDSKTEIEELSKKIRYPVMVKPVDGSGSRGATRVDEPHGLFLACQTAINNSISGKAEIEKFVAGVEYGAESLVLDGKTILIVLMKKLMTNPPYYAELGHAIPSGLPTEFESKVKAIIEHAIKVLGIVNGSVNMDLIISREGDVHIVDIGLRMGGNLIGSHIVPYGTGIEYLENLIRLSVDDPIAQEEKPHDSVATRLIVFEKTGIVNVLPDFSLIEEKFNVEIEENIKIGKRVHSYRNNLDGCGYIVCCRPEVSVAERVVEEVLKYIQIYTLIVEE